jgi:hypothetical protein
MTVATLSELSTCLKETLKELIHLLLDLLAEAQDHQLVDVGMVARTALTRVRV